MKTAKTPPEAAMDDVVIEIPTACCRVVFDGAMTGRDANTNPGVRFKVLWDDGVGEGMRARLAPNGVIARDEAARLHAALGRFLAAHPPA